MALLAVLRSGGLSIAQKTLSAASPGGDSFVNDGKTLLEVAVGTTATTITVTSVPCSHGRTKDAVFGPVTSQTHLLGPFDPALFNDSTGHVNITYSQTTGVTVAPIRNTAD